MLSARELGLKETKILFGLNNAGDERIELSPKVLETFVLPLN